MVKKPYYRGTTRWINIGTLKYDVKNHTGKVILKAGTPNVHVAFRSGKYCFTDADGNLQRVNLYKVRGHIIKNW